MGNFKEDSDLIADIIWWLRGYMAANPESDKTRSCSGYLSPDHISALVHAKSDAEKKEEEIKERMNVNIKREG
jgi:hypothetical protein